MELMHRDKHHPHSVGRVLRMAPEAWKSVLVGKEVKGRPLYRERTSLIATARKLLWPHILLSSVGTEHHGQQPLTDGRFVGKHHQFGLSHMLELMPHLVMAVRAIKDWQIDIRRDSDASTTNASISSNSYNSSSGSSSRRSNKRIKKGPATTSMITPDHTDPFLAHSMHQMHAILVLTLIQSCLWLQKFALTFTGDGTAIHEWAFVACDALDTTPDPHLLIMAKSILSDPTPAMPEAPTEVCLAWERYAVLHFPGKLLPGCCHLGCTNLDSASEACLGTLLCGGCRKARYCSRECQRAAWREGRHMAVCGLK